MNTRKAPMVVGTILILIPVLYFTSCSIVSNQKARAFERVHLGDTEQQVIETMGVPTDREISTGRRLVKYGIAACTTPCTQRLWYPNNLSLAGEAWSIEFDATGHVVHTAHIASP